jgi:hypothetical protein
MRGVPKRAAHDHRDLVDRREARLMAQTKEGALKVRAAKVGLTPVEYVDRLDQGLKYCGLCLEWKSRNEFHNDRSRFDGKVPYCADCKNGRARERHVPVAEPQRKGPSPIPARDGDAKQARRKVNAHLEAGRWPHPNTLPCADCGHTWAQGERRHEYDHHKGYAAEHHEDVEVVCTRCHRKREIGRGER